jgi:alpha-1,3/alpha-1,6-mannosyltransferase
MAGRLHIVLAHLSQFHLTMKLLFNNASDYDVFFVDQLSTCVPFLRHLARRRVVFYCHFPDKLLADGEFIVDASRRRGGSLLKRSYRLPMDWVEEQTTGALPSDLADFDN